MPHLSLLEGARAAALAREERQGGGHQGRDRGPQGGREQGRAGDEVPGPPPEHPQARHHERQQQGGPGPPPRRAEGRGGARLGPPASPQLHQHLRGPGAPVSGH